MRKILFIGGAFVLIAAFAFISPGGAGTTASERGMTMEGDHHMMGEGMMQDMSGMMHEMMGMMQMMSQTMGHKTVTEHMKMAEMAKVMEEMSAAMHDMAGHMAQGKMSSKALKQMRDRIGKMHGMMKGIEAPK